MLSTSAALFLDHDYVLVTRFVYCLLTQVDFFFFLPDFGADSFCANSFKVALFSVKFVMAPWRPKHDHCPERRVSATCCSSHTGCRSLGEPSEAGLEHKLRENPFTDSSHPGDEGNWPTWRGLTTTDSAVGLKFCNSHERRVLLGYHIDFVSQDQ